MRKPLRAPVYKPWLLVLWGCTMFILSTFTYAGNFELPAYDLEGSHALKSSSESGLSSKKIQQKGLEVKWFTPLDGPILGVPMVIDGTVYVSTLNQAAGSGHLYSIKGADGTINWSKLLPGGGTHTLISGNHVYANTFTGGRLMKFDRNTGDLVWTYSPNLTPTLDNTVGGMTLIQHPVTGKDMIIYPVQPTDEAGVGNPGITAIIAVDAQNGEEVWKFYPACASNTVCPFLPIYNNGVLASTSYVGGDASWGNAISYSKSQKLLFFGTGQNTHSVGFGGATPGSDSIFAIRAADGSFVWETQTKQGDLYNFFTQGFDPVNPLDMDIGDAPALFKNRGHEYLSVGSKRGYFYILDTENGSIINQPSVGPAVDSLGFSRGLLLSSDYAGPVVGVGIEGGVNLDSGFYKSGNEVIHFGIRFSMLQGMNAVASGIPPWNGQPAIGPFPVYPAGVCTYFLLGLPNSCPEKDSGTLFLVDTLGSQVLGEYTSTAGSLTGPIYLNDMIFVYQDSSGTFDPNNPSVPINNVANNRLIVVDVSNPTIPKLLESVNLINPNNPAQVAKTVFGANSSISNGMIYTGSGFVGSGVVGLFAIGLK